MKTNITSIEQALEEAALISDSFDKYTRRSLLNAAVWGFINNQVFVLNREVIAYRNDRVTPPDRVAQDEQRAGEAESLLRYMLTVVRSDDDVQDAATTVDRFIARQTEAISDEEDNLTVKYLVRFKKLSEEKAQQYIQEERADTRKVLDAYRDTLVRDLDRVLQRGAFGGEEYFEPNAYQLRTVANTLIRQAENQIEWNLDRMTGSSGKFKLNLMSELERLEVLLESAKDMSMGAERAIEQAQDDERNAEIDSEATGETTESDTPHDPQTEDGQTVSKRWFGIG